MANKMDKKGKAKATSKKGQEKEEKGSGKIAGVFLFLGTLICILIVIASMIRLDVGGFGSEVLAPVLGPIPVINRILPEGAQTKSEKESLEEESSRQAELESKKQEEQILKESEAASLKAYESQSAAILESQAEAESRALAESQSIAESQSLEEESSALADYVDAYSKMDAKNVAALLDNMVSGDIDLVVKILSNLKADKRAEILANMDVNNASKVSVLLSP